VDAPLGQVLLVEDDEVNQLYGRALLEKMGHAVCVAADGAEAVDQWRKRPFDMVLMDCSMPRMDGFAATAIMRAEEQACGAGRTMIVATTGAVMTGERERCLAAGMDGVIGKPFAAEQLLPFLRGRAGAHDSPAGLPARSSARSRPLPIPWRAS
jgi:CheY-like chemotaxis protein